jgi:hypothetical protein
MFYGKTWASPDSVGHVDFHRLTVAELTVMTALFLLSVDAISDPVSIKPFSERIKVQGKSQDPPDVETLEVEILPPEQDERRRHPH